MRNIKPNDSDIELIEQLRKIHSSSCYNELIALSKKSSLLTRIEKDNSENILSKLIRNVLNDIALNNSLPVAPMGLLLRYIASKEVEKGNISSLNKALLTNSDIDVETGYINQEESFNKSYSAKLSGRIDIFAKGRIKYRDTKGIVEEQFCLVIENKIKTREHDNQCKAYYDFIEKKYADISNRFYVYLDPKENKTECKAYINISYNDLMHHVLEPILSEIKYLGGKIPDDYQRDLKELIDTLQHPSKFMNDQPIALSKEYRELLSCFYKENKELILLAAKECANEDDFTTIENGFNQRYQRIRYIITHPEVKDYVEANEKMLLETLLLQYEKLGKDFEYIKKQFKNIGKFFVIGSDKTTGYGEPVNIGGKTYRISNQKARKGKQGRLKDIVTIAESDGFNIKEKQKK